MALKTYKPITPSLRQLVIVERVLGVDGPRPMTDLEPVVRTHDVDAHADVHDADRCARLTGKDVDRGAAGKEVGDHLRGDLCRVRRHTRLCDAVVGRDQDKTHPLEPSRWAPALHATGPHGQLLEPPQCSGRLGQPRLSLQGSCARRRVGRTDARDDIREERRRGHASRWGMPVVTSHTSSQVRASRALRAPSASRKRRPDSVGGTTPEPTSLVTTTMVPR